jgi:hypothetical protein
MAWRDCAIMSSCCLICNWCLVPIGDDVSRVIEGGGCLGDVLLQVLVQFSRELLVVIPGDVLRTKSVQHTSEEFGGYSEMRRVSVVWNIGTRLVEWCPHAIGAKDQLLRDKRVLTPRFGLLIAGLPIVAPIGVF